MQDTHFGPNVFLDIILREEKLLLINMFSCQKKYGIAPSTFANAFVNDRPFVTSNIIGATTMDQLKENIDSVDVEINAEMHKEIENIHSNIS